jgi:phenylacetate-CoA ligase
MRAAHELTHDFYDMLVESQYWPYERLLEYQREQLSFLLRHARKNVPFYENRLDAVSRADGSIDWDRWHEIPIVRRQDLQQRREEMHARQVPNDAGRMTVATSSATTGVPVVSSHNQQMFLKSGAAKLRCHIAHKLDFSKNHVTITLDDPPAGAWPDGRDVGAWGPRWLPGQRGRVLELNIGEPPQRFLEFMARKEAGYLSATAVRTCAFALEARRLGMDVALDYVMTRGDGATSDQVELIREIFGAEVLGLYSSKEGHAMACPCPEHSRYHVNMETVLLEIVGSDGRPCVPGETGRVLITPYFNFSQPLIRYDLSDLATVGMACDCGRTLPVIDSIVGRVIQMFHLPDGGVVMPELPFFATRAMNADMVQMAQVGPNDVEIRYVPATPNSLPDENTVRDAALAVLQHDFNITFRRIERFKLPPSGKLARYINEWSYPQREVTGEPG